MACFHTIDLWLTSILYNGRQNVTGRVRKTTIGVQRICPDYICDAELDVSLDLHDGSFEVRHKHAASLTSGFRSLE